VSEFVTIDQAAKSLNLETRVVRALAITQIIPAKLENGQLLVNLPALTTFNQKMREFMKILREVANEQQKRDDITLVTQAVRRYARGKGYETVSEAAARLRMTRNAIRHLVEQGKVKAIRVGRNLMMVKVDDTLLAIAAQMSSEGTLAKLKEAIEVLSGD